MSMLCCYHTFQKLSWQELGNELCYIVPEICTWLNKCCLLVEPFRIVGSIQAPGSALQELWFLFKIDSFSK